MVVLAGILLMTAAQPTIAKDSYPLRASCAMDDQVLHRLPAGAPVTIRFALAGAPQACYKIQAEVDGKTLVGYVSADALTSVKAFDADRQAGASLETKRVVQEQITALKVRVGSGASGVALARAAELLQQQQPREALRSLEATLAANPRDPQALLLAGFAAYQSDDLPRAIEYLRASAALQSDPNTQALLARIERERAGDNSSERTYGTRFVLRYDGVAVSSSDAREMIGVLEEEYSRVAGQLGCSNDERITTIVQTPEAYYQTTGAAAWSGGQFDGKIRVPLLSRERSGALMRKVFAHEIVHACLARLGQYPAWLHEGMAQHLSGDTLSSAERAQLRALLRDGRIPKLGGVGQNWAGLSSAQAQVAYRYALDAVETMYAEYQSYGITNILTNASLLQQVTKGLDEKLAQ